MKPSHCLPDVIYESVEVFDGFLESLEYSAFLDTLCLATVFDGGSLLVDQNHACRLC